mgnify:CR=1 FL=1
MTATRAFVALGSNLGDRAATLASALRCLAETSGVRLVAASDFHDTAPVGGPLGQPRFLNAVAELECELSPEALLTQLQRIEAQHGRERAVPNGPRTLDLDLLLYGDLRRASAELTLPHPRLEEREFVLAPLAQLAAGLRLERCGRSVAEQLEHLRGACNASGGGHAAPAVTAICQSPQAAAAWLRERRANSASLGFVPTMGALHDGHLALVRRARAENDLVCVSVFVNPLQFDDPRDFERYPRDFAADARAVGGAGADLVFSGTLWEFFPEADGRRERIVNVEAGRAALGLEGAFRPGHFDGVATIVKRLFEWVEPTRAYFGEKDFQQTLVVRELARRRGSPQIVVCPTEREADGLARSSRNALLEPRWRQRAPAIFAALSEAQRSWRDAGERRAEELERVMRAVLASSELEVEYAEVRDPLSWSEQAPRGVLERARALIAARAGAVRLIDNLRLDAGGEDAP